MMGVIAETTDVCSMPKLNIGGEEAVESNGVEKSLGYTVVKLKIGGS